MEAIDDDAGTTSMVSQISRTPSMASITPARSASLHNASENGRSHSSSPWSFHARIDCLAAPRYHPHANHRPISAVSNGWDSSQSNDARQASHNTSSGLSHPAQPRGNNRFAICANEPPSDSRRLRHRDNLAMISPHNFTVSAGPFTLTALCRPSPRDNHCRRVPSGLR